jgi:hypothetical protein
MLERGDVRLLREMISSLLSRFPSLTEFCDRCLRSERWGGSVVLMVVDAALTSSGLNYFTIVVPKVRAFAESVLTRGGVQSLSSLAVIPIENVRDIWRNERQWHVARGIATVLAGIGGDDKEALRRWARASDPTRMREDPIGSIKGVGPVTFHYLRAMGGVDTVIPDRVVKKVINNLLAETGRPPSWRDIDFIRSVEEVAQITGLRRVELCWLAWLMAGEAEKVSSIKIKELLSQL